MKLTIKQSNTPEIVTSELIDGLYNLSSGGNLANDSELEGNLQTTAAYEDSVTYLTSHFPRLAINAASYYIRFADPAVEEALKLKMGKDESEGITTQEASSLALNDTFRNNSTITTFNELVYFKNGTGVFIGCSNLECVDISNATQIPNDMFQHCTKLTKFHGPNSEDKKIIINEGVTSLGQTAFNGLTDISFVIPTSVNTVGWGCFGINNAHVVAEIHLTGQNWLSQWLNMGGSGINIYEDTKIFVDDVQITQIDFTGFTNIGRGFGPMKSITAISNISQVTAINGNFNNCVNLEISDLSLPNLVSISASAFKGTKVQTISDLGSVTSIPESCFNNCSQLTTIEQGVLDKITVLGSNAFNNCTNLGSAKQSDNTISTVLRLPNLTSIALNAVRYTKFTEIADLGSITTVMGFSEMTNLTSVVLPQTCTTIGGSAFVNDKALTTINLNNITSIGVSAFNSCQNLIYFHGTGSVAGELDLSNVTSIGNNAFTNCKKLTSVTIGNSATSIGGSAFSGCSGLTSVTIPNSVTYIGGGAFSGCKMNSIILNEGLLNIDSYAFQNNDIVSITIPSSVQTLSGTYGCFDRCSQLQSVIFLGTTPPSINQIALFYGVPNTCKIYVPDDSMSAYEAALRVKNEGLVDRLTPMSQLPTT